MKKESKNYTAHYSRFILLVIFTLLVADRTFAQCVDHWNNTATCSSSIHGDYNINYNNSDCYKPFGTPLKPSVTDLRQTTADKTVTSVTIGNESFPGAGAVSMSLSINVYKMIGTSCIQQEGPYDASSFPAKFGITFTSGSNIVITKTSTVAAYIGWFFYFTITAQQEGSPAVTRNYFFELKTSAALLGDPHITTVEGVPYDFQSVGEFVALRDSGGSFEIQTRQTAVATRGPGSASNNTAELTTCVSVNTAVAVRIGTHRVSYEPIGRVPDPGSLQLKVDGKLTKIGENGIDLGSGGRIVNSPAGPGVIEIDFPDGATLIVKPWFWDQYKQWYLDLTLLNTVARKGLMGVIPTRSWLPALPDGGSLGPKPESPHERFVQLYGKFADAWRVTNKTSLFDYKSGDSTETFTDKNWPLENAQSCGLPGPPPLPPILREVAEQLCRDIIDPNMRADAIFDVMITGDSSFAKSYLLTQRAMIGTTATRLSASKDTTKSGEPVTFTATVSRQYSAAKGILAGLVEFTVDGKKFGQVNLDANGGAILTTTSLEAGKHKIVAMFIPGSGSTAFSSSSLPIAQTVIDTSILHQWWFWLLVLLIIAGIIALLRKKKNP